MTGVLLRAWGWANRHAGALLLAGLAGVAWRNWRRWKRDKALVAAMGGAAAPAAPEMWPALPRVSVLVAAWNEAGLVDRHIEQFLALRYPKKELILCAGGPDGTYEIARRRAGLLVHVLEQVAGEGKQRSLARCLAQAGGSVVFLTDADCFLCDDAFERTLFPVATGQEQVCTGDSKPSRDQVADPFVIAQAAAQRYSSLIMPEYVHGLRGCNCALTRELLDESGALAVPAASGTDYVLAKELLRSGARIRHCPASQVETEFPTTFRSYLRQQRRWLRNVVLHGQRYGARGEVVRALVTPAAGAAMVAGPVAGLRVGPVAWVVWLLALAHMLLSRLRHWRTYETLSGRRIGQGAWLKMPVYAMTDLVVWAMTWPDLLGSKRRGRW